MSEETIVQAANLIQKAKQVAIVLPSQLLIDTLCSAAALEELIKSQGGKAIIASASKVIPQLPFLSPSVTVQKELGGSNQLVVKVSNANAKPGELRYEMQEDGLVIYIKPENGEFQSQDVTVIPDKANFDLVIILGAANLEQLGSLHSDNAQLFFDTPRLNIDTNPANEYYGTTDIVEVTTSSLSEVIMDIVEKIPSALDSDRIATSILGGIIAQTMSFRDPRTTPATLSKAAKLIEAGARQQDIIQYLYKTKPFPVLQLWGRALARLQANPELAFLSTVITQADIDKTTSEPSAFIEVLRDLVTMVTEYALITLFIEGADGVTVYLAGLPHIKLDQYATALGGAVGENVPLLGKYQFTITSINKPVEEAREMMLQMLRKNQ